MLLETIIILTCVIIVAGIVRGFTGFGFAAIAVVGMNIFITPQQSIPVVLALDVICGAPLMRQALKQGDTETFKQLTLGSIIGVPLGIGLLFLMPSVTLKLAICIAILLFAALLIIDFRVRNADTNLVTFAFGILAGTSTSGASIGGPIIVCYMLSSRLNTAAQRATMIMFFVVSESLALMALFFSGLFGKDALTLIALLVIPTFIAVRIGQWLFNQYSPKSLKHSAIPILVMVALIGISTSIGGFSI